jgi:translation initiation factor 3 subunit B
MAEASEHQFEHFRETQERLERLGLDQSDPEVMEVAEYLSDNEEDVIEEKEPEIDIASSIVVVDGLPVVPEKKIPKLSKFLFKIYSQFGEYGEEDFTMPVQDGKTLGFAFIAYADKDAAKRAIRETDQFEMDKKHTLTVCPFSKLAQWGAEPDEYESPVQEPFRPKEELFSHLTDKLSRDQFVMRYARETEIFWADGRHEPTLCTNGNREKTGKSWCEREAVFSPEGTYLATFHSQGVQLWGGKHWKNIKRFAHREVMKVNFSPRENYMVTWDGHTDPSKKDAIIVWDVRSGKQLRKFAYPGAAIVTIEGLSSARRTHGQTVTQPGSGSEGTVIGVNSGTDVDVLVTCAGFRPAMTVSVGSEEDAGMPVKVTKRKYEWPFFKWSHDDKFLACKKFKEGKCDAISIYQTPDMKLHNKSSLPTPNCEEFYWAPRGVAHGGKISEDADAKADPVLSYYTLERGNAPASVKLYTLPSRKEMRSKNLVNVKEIKMHWQAQGRYLCMQVTRHTKSRKTCYTDLNLFHMAEKDTPIDMLEIKDDIKHFAWEPNGDRFGVIHGEGQHRLNVSFYSMRDNKGRPALTHLYMLEDKQANKLYWSPMGNNVVLAGLDIINGQLEFYDVNAKYSMATQTHFMCNHISWDPSGREVCTAVVKPMFGGDSLKYELENGYTLWTFQGVLILKKSQQKFYSFQWRPRPPLLLTLDEQRKIEKNLRKYINSYQEVDKQANRLRFAKQRAERRKLVLAYQALLSSRAADVERHVAGLKTNNWEQSAEDDYEYMDDVEESLVSETSEVLK